MFRTVLKSLAVLAVVAFASPIIAQQAVEIQAGETVDELSMRMHTVEHELYPKVIRWLSEGRVQLKDRQVTIIAE